MPSERERMAELTDDASNWRRWGCYVSERSWGTVREDYSANGDAWNYFPHELARSKAYRWGDDAIAGICDRYQQLIFAPAFWNHRDPYLKERLFGLSNPEGNHGEDVKECYFHLDNTPTHSYMRYLYKYPQRCFPYRQLVEENRARNTRDSEFELTDTGIFNDNRYFDITIEYAKVDTEDICIRITAANRGPEAAPFDLLAQLWFRNTWSWGAETKQRPSIKKGPGTADCLTLLADGAPIKNEASIPVEYAIGERALFAAAGGALLFTENETNMQRVYGSHAVSRTPHVKDAFHRQIVSGQAGQAISQGTKAAAHYRTTIAANSSAVWRFRLTDKLNVKSPLAVVDGAIEQRKREADEFYDSLVAKSATEEERRIQRQAWSGLLWTKQSYPFDVQAWLEGDNPQLPPPKERLHIRNEHWRHLNSLRVMLVPDKWEYPWFASWDLAFQSVALATVDPKFAMDQLWVLLFEQFQHPSGQIPAYEWEFSDLNPPVHAWAVWRVYNMARIHWGIKDRAFLERCFHKLLMNFAWWINKVDREGNNVFEGGFLGLDNITVVDRSRKLPDGSVLQQSDATGWMGMFCLNLMRIALELAKENPVYEGLAIKFFQHYVYVANAMKQMGGCGYRLFDDEDGFFYDVLRLPDGSFRKFRVRSLVGLIPLFAVERLEANWLKPFTRFRENVRWFLENRCDMVKEVVHTSRRGDEETLVLTIVNDDQLRQILRRVVDPSEFLSEYGVRSLAKSHAWQPFSYDGAEVSYEPGESLTRIKGGNSNWRGPIWFPTCFLLIESLRKLAKAWGDDFSVSTPEGRQVALPALARDLASRLIRLYTTDADGRRAALGREQNRFRNDPHWRDLPQFHEYFHGETGEGLGATHMTGWTALVASLIDEWRK